MAVYLHILLSIVLLVSQEAYSEINLVWQGADWEQDWIMELLSGTDINLVKDGKYEKFLDNSIIVINYVPKVDEYMKKLNEMGYRFGIIHLSDEVYTVPTDFYKYAQFVFRNYWHKKYNDQSKVICFPLGYKKDFWSGCTKEKALNSDRKYNWSFAGQINGISHAHRRAMIREMKKIVNNHVHQILRWADAHSLSVADYRNLMLDSYFIPSPRGNWNIDSYRVCEALECGCIPIVEKSPLDYFNNFFGEYPFISVHSWSEAPHILNELIEFPDLLQQKRIECYDWWQNCKKKINKKFLKVITKYLDI